MSYSKKSIPSNDSDEDNNNYNQNNRRIRTQGGNNNNSNSNNRNKNKLDSDDDEESSYHRSNYRRPIRNKINDDDDDDDENYEPRYSRQGSFRKPTNERSSSFVPRHIEQDDNRYNNNNNNNNMNNKQRSNSWVNNGRRNDEGRNIDENGKTWTQAKTTSNSIDRNNDRDVRSSRISRRSQSDDDDDDDVDIIDINSRRSRVDRKQRNLDLDNSYEETEPTRSRPVKPPPRGDRSYRNNNSNYNNYNDNDDDNNNEIDYNSHRNTRSSNRNDRDDNRSRSGSNSSRRQQNRSNYDYDNDGDENNDNHNNNNNNNNRSNNNNHYSNGNSNYNSNELVRRGERQVDLGRGNDTDEDDILSDDGADIIKQEHDLKDRDMNDGVMRLGSNIPVVLLSPPNGGSTDLVECLIIRDRSGVSSSLYPTYKLYLENKLKLLLIAQKMNMNTTSNYHLFDMSRGTVGGALSKKSGNYLGKLRALDSNRTEYAIVTRSEEREEVAGVIFERISIVNQLKEGCQPRKMTVLLPNLNAESEPIPHQVNSSKGGKKSLVDMIKNSETGRMFLLKSKEPVFENGNYRLNFHGRVSVPSVKNFQLSSPDDPTHVVCQFGKIGEDRFHLDYKAPLNAFQAFGLALCHFDT